MGGKFNRSFMKKPKIVQSASLILQAKVVEGLILHWSTCASSSNAGARGWCDSSVPKAIEPMGVIGQAFAITATKVVTCSGFLSQTPLASPSGRLCLLKSSNPICLYLHMDLFKQWRMFKLLLIFMELGDLFKGTTSHKLSRCEQIVHHPKLLQPCPRLVLHLLNSARASIHYLHHPQMDVHMWW